LNADGYNVVVYPAGRGWSFRVSNRLTEKILASRRVLVSMDAAKLTAFDAMIWMKERGDRRWYGSSCNIIESVFGLAARRTEAPRSANRPGPRR
jgi:hypothetical protein